MSSQSHLQCVSVYLQWHAEQLRNLMFQHVIEPQTTEEVKTDSWSTATRSTQQTTCYNKTCNIQLNTKIQKCVYKMTDLPFLCNALAFDIQTIFSMVTLLRASQVFCRETHTVVTRNHLTRNENQALFTLNFFFDKIKLTMAHFQ